MLDKPTASLFSHIKPSDTPWESGGLRDFFLYRSLGIREATGGRVIAQLVKANAPPEDGTGWHRHTAEFHIVLMLQGWARFMYEDKEHLVAAGDCVHQRPGITHFLFDYSPDMENTSKSSVRLISARLMSKPLARCRGPCPGPRSKRRERIWRRLRTRLRVPRSARVPPPPP